MPVNISGKYSIYKWPILKGNNSIALDKVFFQPKSIDIFLISLQKHMLWYSLEVPHQGASNEYPQHMFSSRNKKKKFNWYLLVSTAMQ